MTELAGVGLSRWGGSGQDHNDGSDNHDDHVQEIQIFMNLC